MAGKLLAVVVVVLGLAGLIFYSQLIPEQNRVSGFIEGDEIRLGSRVGGRVAKVLVAEGQQVHLGEVVLELEPYDLLERENEASRSLAAREAEFQRLSTGLRPEEIAQARAQHDRLAAQLQLLEAGPRKQEIEVAGARVRAAEAEVNLAKQLYDRSSTLIKTKAVTPEEFERSSQAFLSAQSMLDIRKQELELLRLGTREEEIRGARAAAEEAKQKWQMAEKGFRPEEIDQARAARDAAQAALDAIRKQKEELQIKSPLDGLIDSLDLQPGDMVAPGAAVLSIVDHRKLWVRAYVPQNRTGLQIGQKLRVTVDSVPDVPLVGSVSFISRQAEFTPSNIQTPEERAKQVFRIKVTLESAADKFRPGMTADVWLDRTDGMP